ncbi:hypothetical protein [Sinorhizobium americanum]|nr:hypothetical protein [Sinorhizobium americanum]
MPESVFDEYRAALISQPVSAVWRGYGSAIFLELGRLYPQVRHDGSVGNPRGEYTVMIEWSWRIENETSIICGSWSEDQDWENVFNSLVGCKVHDVSLSGRLPELLIHLSGGNYVASFMTAEGQPAWTIFARTPEDLKSRFISVENGRVCEGTEKT